MKLGFHITCTLENKSRVARYFHKRYRTWRGKKRTEIVEQKKVTEPLNPHAPSTPTRHVAFCLRKPENTGHFTYPVFSVFFFKPDRGRKYRTVQADTGHLATLNKPHKSCIFKGTKNCVKCKPMKFAPINK